jgi:23S rRNA (cytosine1962-C5)-methyltransferase
MDPRQAWPDFREEHILYEDDAIVVVHKPSGVPSQAAQPDRPDDLVTRLRAFLAHRDGRPEPTVYLGVHQRLDRDTSGLLAFTKDPRANASFAAQIEGRRVEKRYLAGVDGWAPGRQSTVLEDLLAKGEDGRMLVVEPVNRRVGRSPKSGRRPEPSRSERGQRAVTRVEVRARHNRRALLGLQLVTGRTHQARVQLAHARAPIAGDPSYGGSVAPRLMLHAEGLTFEHPLTQKRCSLRDDFAKDEFDAWLRRGDPGYGIYDDARALERVLAQCMERRWGLGRSGDRDPVERRTTAFRLVNEDGDGLPGLAVDVYGSHLVAQLYVSDEWEAPGRRERVLDALHALGFDGVYLKLRPKQANVLVDTRRDDLAPRLPVRGEPAPESFLVYEEGVPFEVRLADGLSTGIFLDQRPNRRAVRAISSGARVANLFSYTCAFSVVAALGGASRTVSVDASLAALERGRRGFSLADVPLGPAHAFVGEDAFTWLAKAARKEERFDLVILDPPSYSTTKKRRFVADSDYGELVALAAAIVAPGGKILACCNHRGMPRKKLRRLIHEGARDAAREVVQLKDQPDALDFPGVVGRDPHMKSLLLTLR